MSGADWKSHLAGYHRAAEAHHRTLASLHRALAEEHASETPRLERLHEACSVAHADLRLYHEEALRKLGGTDETADLSADDGAELERLRKVLID